MALEDTSYMVGRVYNHSDWIYTVMRVSPKHPYSMVRCCCDRTDGKMQLWRDVRVCDLEKKAERVV